MLKQWAERTVPSPRTTIALPHPHSTLGSWEAEAHQTEQKTGRGELKPADCCVNGQSVAHSVCRCAQSPQSILLGGNPSGDVSRKMLGSGSQLELHTKICRLGAVFCTYSDWIRPLVDFGIKIRVFRGTHTRRQLTRCSRSQLLTQLLTFCPIKYVSHLWEIIVQHFATRNSPCTTPSLHSSTAWPFLGTLQTISDSGQWLLDAP